MFISNHTFEYDDKGDLVYFEIDMSELFNIKISHRGIRSVLRKAFRQSRLKTPIKTGILRRSYTMEYKDNTKVRCYFDPKKMIGKMRYGKPVKVYYAKYLHLYTKTYSWLDIVMQEFLRVLLSGIRELNKNITKENKQKKSKDLRTTDIIQLSAFIAYLGLFTEEVKRKVKEQIEQEERKNEFKNIKILVHQEQEILK